jgi:pimeloyl-ACP methyl ester carboxylesterase
VQLAQSLPTATHMIVNTLVRINTARDTERVRKMLLHDVDKTSMESFFRSIGDLRRTDLSPNLGALTVPILGIYGEHDNIVDPHQVELLDKYVTGARTLTLHRSRHFPMLDEPDEFNATVRSFLAA